MQPNKTKLALTMGALLFAASNYSYAAQGTFPITATTLTDVTLANIQDLDFGTNVYTTLGGTCELNADDPDEADSYENAGTASAGVNYENLSGTGCIAASTDVGQTAGIYEISGVAGLDVTVTVDGSSLSAFFTFVPDSACAVNYDGATSGTGDTCDALTPSVGKVITLHGGADDGVQVNGKARIVVGGTITIDDALTPNLAYTDTFTVNVVY